MVSLHYREFWSALSNWLVNELDQLVASIQAAWSKEHKSDGTHGDVTATTVSSPLVAATCLSLSSSANVAAQETSGGDEVIRVVQPASPTAIVDLVPDTAVEVYLLAMSTVGRSIGEVVILRAAYDYGATHFGFVIRSNVSTTIPGNAARFLTLGDGSGTDYDSPTFGVGESVVVRLESAPPTPTSSFATYWRVLGVLSIP